ncbi:MAG TPA: PIG-L deacetylase family protein, partial [Gemmatimonadaceae bacterium]|nr:PIG-L deacetylase family protein [Gemmatimonadaceae bacterium]
MTERTREPRRLMAVLAHPDDESLGTGGTLATYAARGVETYVVTATRGERGRFFTNENRPSDEEVGRVREAELRAAARELGVREVTLLGYHDGALDAADPVEAQGRIVAELRRVRPQVVVTFDPYGAYGHPDHVAICQLTTAAVVAAADAAHRPDAGPAHRVAKLYYFVSDAREWAAYQAAFKTLVSRVDGCERQAVAWPDWAITTELDTHAHWETVWRAVQCHETQLAVYARLAELTPEHHEALWGRETFYRALSVVN